MLPPLTLEKADSYLRLQLSRSTHPFAHPAEPFVTLSREAGAGASSVAHELAEQLNADLAPDQAAWTLFDSNLVEEMLTAHRYATTLAQFLPEDAVSEVTASVGELVGLHPNLWDLTQKTNALIRRLARLGRCILIGRGANFATRDLPAGVHVRLVGSPAQRARHMASVLGLSVVDATSRNLRVDSARRRYVQRIFGQDIDDPAAYDLVLNTDHLPITDTARIIAQIVHARRPVSASATA